MKTREQIYGNEASGLLRNITMYKSLSAGQIVRLYPGKEKTIKNLLSYLSRQGRIYHNPESGNYSADKECDARADPGMTAAVWVMLDFIDRIEFHTTSEFPVKISFFASGELYEIIHVPFGNEILMNHALAGETENPARRIVLVECPEQIDRIDILNAAGFCTVDPDGSVQYYKINKE